MYYLKEEKTLNKKGGLFLYLHPHTCETLYTKVHSFLVFAEILFSAQFFSERGRQKARARPKNGRAVLGRDGKNIIKK
jgi:hypothetical protein